MKKLLFMLMSVLATYLLPAQYCGSSGSFACSPNGFVSQPGFGLQQDSASPFINTVASSTVMQFQNYNALNFGGNFLTIQSLTIDSINNLPAGLCWASDQANNTYANQQFGCIGFSGTTCSAPGQYKLGFYVSVVLAGGISLHLNGDAVGIKLIVRVFNSGETWVPVDTSQTAANPFIPYGPVSPCIPTLNISLGGSRAVCYGNAVNAAVSTVSGQPPYTYQWSSTGDSLSCYNCQGGLATITQNSVYKVTVSDFNGSTATDSVDYSLVTNSAHGQFSITNSFIDCTHQTDTATVVVTNTSGFYIVNWGDGVNEPHSGAGTFTHVYTQPGSYSPAVFDTLSGCSSGYAQFNIRNLGINDSFSTVAYTSCTGVATGKIFVNAAGATPPYTYLWINGATTDNITNLAGGNYSVTVTDASQCTAVFNYTVNDSANTLQAYVYAGPVNCNGQDSISGVAYNGNPPYSYLWSTGSTNDYLLNVPAAFYSLTVTDANGCTAVGGDSAYTYCYSYITGYVFDDANNNCVFDVGESGQTATTISATLAGQQYFGFSDASGYYSIAVPAIGTYQINIYNNGNCVTSTNLCGNANQTVTVSNMSASYDNNNIGLVGVSGYNLGIHPGWTSSSPGSSKDYWTYYYNTSGVYTGPVTVTFQYDGNLVFVSSDVPYTTFDLTNHIITWVISNFNNGTWDYIGLVHFNVPASLPLNYTLQSDFRIDPVTTDCDTSDNHYHFSEPLIGSHDPNEKTVQPAGNITTRDSVLTYTIHFQNTGTAAASRVVVVDSLSSNLDPTTVRNIASSHTYSNFAISGIGVLTWTFDPINLPDSSADRAASTGFITFTVKQRSNLPLSSAINNTAAIYFDFNRPVYTNTVSNTITTGGLGIKDFTATNGINVAVFPNPFSSVASVVVSGINEKFDFELLDVTGRVQRQMRSIQNAQFELNRDNLAAGVYFYRISVNAKQAAWGKVVIE